MQTIAGSLIGIGLLAIAAAVTFVGSQLVRLRADLDTALRPTAEDRLARVAAQTQANVELLETKKGRETFFNYIVSEAALWDFIEGVAQSMKNEAIDLEERRKQIIDDKLSRWDRAKRFFSNAKPEFVTTLVGKLNDLVGRFLPGGNPVTRKA